MTNRHQPRRKTLSHELPNSYGGEGVRFKKAEFVMVLKGEEWSVYFERLEDDPKWNARVTVYGPGVNQAWRVNDTPSMASAKRWIGVAIQGAK